MSKSPPPVVAAAEAEEESGDDDDDDDDDAEELMLNKRGEYLIDSVLQQKLTGKVEKVEVKWKGYKKTTWEPLQSLGQSLRKQWEECWARRSEGKDNSLYACQTPIDEMVDDG
jgi:hypothetical protein